MKSKIYIFFWFFVYKMEKDLTQINSTELRDYAKNNNFHGYGKHKRKADLLNFLLNYVPPGPSLKELKAFAQTNKIKGYSKYTKKADLLNFLNPPAISVSQMKVGGSVLEYQSKKKQTRREKRDKKNFVYSFNEDLLQVNQEEKLNRLKKSLAGVKKKIEKTTNKNATKTFHDGTISRKKSKN